MQIKIKRFDKSLPLPAYKTPGAAAFDLCSRTDIVIPVNQSIIVPLNIALEVPVGFHSILLLRSSAQRLGIFQSAPGLIDRDYCGDNDEIMIPVINYTTQEIFIEKGTRIAQLLVHKTEFFDLLEVDHLDNKDRGGFGTTGLK